MKILCVIDSLGSGGAQRQILNLIIGLKKKGYNVELFLYYSKFNHYEYLIKKHKIKLHHGDSKISKLFTIYKLIKIVNKNVTHIISYQQGANILCSFIKLIKPRVKLIVSERTSFLAKRSTIRKFFVHITYLLSNSITCNSATQKTKLEKNYNYRKKLKLIRNGFPLENVVFKNTFISDKIKNILVIGRITPNKNGLLVLIAAKNYFNKGEEFPNVLFIGRVENNNSSIEYKKVLDNWLLKNPAIKDKIQFLGEVRDVKDYYSGNSVIVVPSFYEGFPNVACEAMIYQCPLFISNVCDHTELSDYGRRAFLFSPNSYKSLSRSFEYFEALPNDTKKYIVKNAYEYSKMQFSEQNLVKNMVEIF